MSLAEIVKHSYRDAQRILCGFFLRIHFLLFSSKLSGLFVELIWDTMAEVSNAIYLIRPRKIHHIMSRWEWLFPGWAWFMHKNEGRKRK